jgi:hypothetical protein
LLRLPSLRIRSTHVRITALPVDLQLDSFADFRHHGAGCRNVQHAAGRVALARVGDDDALAAASALMAQRLAAACSKCVLYGDDSDSSSSTPKPKTAITMAI